MSTNGYTRAFILDNASELASRFGLARLSGGLVARHITRPKSTVFFHFPTTEELQLGVLQYSAEELIRLVVRPASRLPAGLPRLERLVELWFLWDGKVRYSGGCLFAAVGFEFEDRPGPVRERVVRLHKVWGRLVCRQVRAAIAAGTFRPDTDPDQFAFDLLGIMLAHHHTPRLGDRPDADYHARLSFAELVEWARGGGQAGNSHLTSARRRRAFGIHQGGPSRSRSPLK